MTNKISIEKLKALFEKGDIEEQVEKFEMLKNFVTEKLVNQAAFHEEEHTKILGIKDRVNQNGSQQKSPAENEA